MDDLRTTYERAERFCEWNVRARVRNVTVTPHWLPDGDRFWYEHQVPGGTEIRLVDPTSGAVSVLDAPPAGPPRVPAGRLRSPDGRHDLLRLGADLAVAPVVPSAADPSAVDEAAADAAASPPPRALTTGGEPDCGYGLGAESSTTFVTNQRAGVVPPPVALWSPDSRRVVTHLLDQRAVPPLHLLDSRPPDGAHPQLWTYRMPLVGEPIATAALVVIDLDTGAVTPVEGDPLLVEWGSPIEIGWVWWSHDSTEVWFLREARGAQRLELCIADAATGAVRTIVTEEADDWVEPHPLLPWASQVREVPGGRHAVWITERTGWRHLDLIDLVTGGRTPLTAGEWAVREVLDVDGSWVWFTACGREPGRDPYFRATYRVPLGGGDPELLTPEDADHATVLSPSRRFLLDTTSTIDTAPVTRVRTAAGALVAEVVTADLSALHADGWTPPERFCVRGSGADGVTELYGVIYRPCDFDPSRRYPVIDSFYPGPQLIRTPKSFTVDDSAGVDAWPGPWGAQALAELGFVVVNVDGRGAPLRSRTQHHATAGHLEDHALDDHVTALHALAADRPWMDLGRGVGAQGHSAGAAATVRALLTRPELFTVGVAGSGVHDLRRYVAYWGEKYQGLVGEADYDHQSNLDLADRLEGELLLIHGELDDNVHPSNTLAMYDAFVQADRDVELVLLAGWGHPCWTHPYYVRRSWDFFVRHLLGQDPPAGYRVTSAPPA